MGRGGRKGSVPGLRTCIGCRTVRPKAELQRLVLGPDGAVRCEQGEALRGRGAYLCPTEGCAMRAARRLEGARKSRLVGAGVAPVTPAALWAAVQAARGA
jgi:predicted RNA-binding protein YlxR (DUF448 family)